MTDLTQLSEQEILGLTIYGEARGEPIEGQIAVGCVIRNRLHNSINRTYHDICLAPKQFSCWNEDDPNRIVLEGLSNKIVSSEYTSNVYLNQCLFVAEGIVENHILDNTKNANNYMTVALYESKSRPGWAYKLREVAEIGNHVFLV